MPLISLLRSLFGLLSLAILLVAGWLLWSWWVETELVTVGADTLIRRQDWRLWTGGALLLWSFAGRVIVLMLVGTPDGDPTRAVRSPGETLDSPTGACLHVEREGSDGPTIILTHGWGLDSTIWYYARRDLGRRRDLEPHRLLTWDLPGLGRSRRSPTGVTLENYAADLAFLIAEQDGPVVLAGHSIGGMIIQTLARDHPAVFARAVAGVVLINTTHTNPLRTMILSPLALALRRPLIEPLLHLTIWLQPLAWISAWQGYLSGSTHLANRLGFGRTATRSQLEHVSLLATRNSPAIQARGMLAMLDWDATGGMAQARCPTLVIGGELDIVTCLEASETIVRDTPYARLDRVGGVNHMGFLEHAPHYNDQILEFAREVTPTAATRAPAGDPWPGRSPN